MRTVEILHNYVTCRRRFRSGDRHMAVALCKPGRAAGLCHLLATVVGGAPPSAFDSGKPHAEDLPRSMKGKDSGERTGDESWPECDSRWRGELQVGGGNDCGVRSGVPPALGGHHSSTKAQLYAGQAAAATVRIKRALSTSAASCAVRRDGRQSTAGHAQDRGRNDGSRSCGRGRNGRRGSSCAGHRCRSRRPKGHHH